MSKLMLFIALLPLVACGNGDMTITNGHVTVKSCQHDAGAVCSVRYRGVEYIDDKDHGRQMQSAASFSGLGESFNPTEAGALRDGFNPSPSSSVLLGSWSNGDTLATATKMAYWLPVGGQNTSNHTMNKMVTVGAYGMPNVIQYSLQHNMPSDESHSSGVFEVLTGYMPCHFAVFNTFDPATETLAPLSDDAGEQRYPVVISSGNGQHAMGAWSPHLNQPAYQNSGYGRWRFVDQNVTKWNVVYRYDNPAGVYHFKIYVFVGTLTEVRASMRAVYLQYN